LCGRAWVWPSIKFDESGEEMEQQGNCHVLQKHYFTHQRQLLYPSIIKSGEGPALLTFLILSQ
jgi:hypothetical protein